MTESIPPPPGSGGNLKYGAVGVALIIAAVALWFGMDSCGDGDASEGVAAAPDAGIVSEDRSAALANDDLFIPELEPDTGPAPDAGGPRIRYVTRYAGGGGGRWNCRGEVNASAAQRALSQHALQFRNCYERRLKVNNTLEGNVRVDMRVGGNGRVSAVRTGGSLRDPQVLSCVRTIAQRITFPNPTGGCATVSAPFTFTPRR